MNRNVKLAAVFALLAGATLVRFAPAGWMPGLVVVPFALCIPLAWFVIFSSRAVDFTKFRWFGWPFKLSAVLVPSPAFWALCVLAAFVVGACLGILIANANA